MLPNFALPPNPKLMVRHKPKRKQRHDRQAQHRPADEYSLGNPDSDLVAQLALLRRGLRHPLLCLGIQANLVVHHLLHADLLHNGAEQACSVNNAPTISGSHQLLLPRLMSSKVFDGAANVFVTRCHWFRPAPPGAPSATG